MPDSKELQAVALELRRLVEASPADPTQLAHWEAQSQTIDARLRSIHSDVFLPIQVLHYMNDGEIRASDLSYREMQNAFMLEFISSLEHGELPKSRGTTLSFSPWSLLLLLSFSGFLLLFALRSCG